MKRKRKASKGVLVVDEVTPRGEGYRIRARVVRGTSVLAAVLMVTAAGVAIDTAPAEAAPPTPPFGPGIDPYQPDDTPGCDPVAKPGTVAFKDMVLAAYPETADFGIIRDCSDGDPSDHWEGRAWDWKLSAATQAHLADDLLNWLMATDQYGNQHALLRRLGIKYIIWNRQIWSSYRAAEGWRTYEGENPHIDHMHISFGWDGALQRTSWWTGPPPGPGKTTVGFYQPADARFNLRNTNVEGPPDASFPFGWQNMVPLAGDWNGDGKSTIGYYNPPSGQWVLRNLNTDGTPDAVFYFGPPNMLPVVGDWNGDGKATIGFYNPSNGQWKLRNSNTEGPPDAVFEFGPPGMIPVAGDWNADGKATIGYHNPANGEWVLRNSNTAGPADAQFVFGPAGVRPVVGDWNGDRKVTVGFFNPSNGHWKLRNSNTAGNPDAAFRFGPNDLVPIAGDWDNA